jgi:hypothetical protein
LKLLRLFEFIKLIIKSDRLVSDFDCIANLEHRVWFFSVID